ncbi:DUF5789 family protein [Halocalculus aciditolerans]|uniref:Uncharacterized protein n=1 Tax=Halocalculus aciditolerans TaxID=1383812 RepID=A0A830F380_9EURY|nr:hypothetical protein [Halocalculus aciditolerans]GGL58235.1 hypothetical protein GCM10009039_15590 [Halocalculus aciditolerans]
MAAPPPTSDDDDDPAALAFGIAAVETHIEGADIEWPATSEEIVAATGDPDIPYNPHGSTVRLGEILDQTRQSTFDSRRDLLNALHPRFEEYRRSRSGGILGQLRSLLPF